MNKEHGAFLQQVQSAMKTTQDPKKLASMAAYARLYDNIRVRACLAPIRILWAGRNRMLEEGC